MKEYYHKLWADLYSYISNILVSLKKGKKNLTKSNTILQLIQCIHFIVSKVPYKNYQAPIT